MLQTAKLVGDIMAVALIVFILGLTVISLLAVWKIIDVQDVMYKSVFSFSILLASYLVVALFARYWELHQGNGDGVLPPA